jgi:hypothetical protein
MPLRNPFPSLRSDTLQPSCLVEPPNHSHHRTWSRRPSTSLLHLRVRQGFEARLVNLYEINHVCCAHQTGTHILWMHCLLLSTYLRERTFICTLDLPCCLRLPSFGSLYTAELVRAVSSNRNPTRPQRGRPMGPPHHAAWGV